MPCDEALTRPPARGGVCWGGTAASGRYGHRRPEHFWTQLAGGRALPGRANTLAVSTTGPRAPIAEGEREYT
eukprot:75976-Prorocentrum_minimum.AAC.1